MTNTKIARPFTQIVTKLEDLVLSGLANGVVHESSINGKPEDDQIVGPEAKDSFT